MPQRNQSTWLTKEQAADQRQWWVVDLDGKTLGRAATTIASALQGEESGNLRTMLLREYNKRLDENDLAGLDIMRGLALNDPDPNVRAEAVTILGRRGDLFQ